MTKILVVDDETTLVATLRFNLEKEGFTVLTAAEGESAVALAREHRPDLIVLDLLLEGIHGFEVCRILRREMPTPDNHPHSSHRRGGQGRRTRARRR